MILSLVVPIYNEKDMIPIFIDRISQVFANNSELKIELIFVNDGSEDCSLPILLRHQDSNPTIKVIDLSRNFGKEAALTAGLLLAAGEVVVPIDVDLQDPPELIIKMIEKWKEGFEVVLGRRIDRDSDSLAKRISARWFYKIHNKISNQKLPENVGDFRLMDRKVIDALKELPESRRFMKGLFAWLGFRTTFIDYVRPKRAAGLTKFDGWKLWNFALEGVTSFSTEPLRIWTYIGFIISLGSFLFGLYIIVRVFLFGIDAPGYASLMVAITFLGGVQLIGIGVLGEYLGRTYIESKRRPIYVIRNIYSNKD